MVKNSLLLLGFMAIFALGVLTTREFYRQAAETQMVDSTVLLERINKVFKLVTIEAEFNELYSQTNERPVTFYLPVPLTWNFPKKATVQVTGKVLVGYDMNEIKITVDSAVQTVYLSNFPDPKILSIDHKVEYKNIEESYFNNFTAADFTQLNQKAREVLEQEAMEKELLKKAELQAEEMLDALRFLIETSGWNVQFGDRPIISTDQEMENLRN